MQTQRLFHRLQRLALVMSSLLLLGLAGYVPWRQKQLDDRFSISTEGVVVQLYQRLAGGRTPPNCWVVYEYSVQEATGARRKIQQTTLVTSALYEKLTVGGPVALRYIPEQPEQARIDGNYDNYAFIRRIFLPLLLAVVGGLAALKAWLDL